MALLLARGADPNHGGVVSYSTLSYAVGLATIADDLYPNFVPVPGADPATPTTALEPFVGRLPCEGNVPPLVAAAFNGRDTIAFRLLGAGADPDALAFGAISPLYGARSQPRVAEILRAAGASVVEEPTASLPPPVSSGDESVRC